MCICTCIPTCAHTHTHSLSLNPINVNTYEHGYEEAMYQVLGSLSAATPGMKSNCYFSRLWWRPCASKCLFALTPLYDYKLKFPWSLAFADKFRVCDNQGKPRHDFFKLVWHMQIFCNLQLLCHLVCNNYAMYRGQRITDFPSSSSVFYSFFLLFLGVYMWHYKCSICYWTLTIT